MVARQNTHLVGSCAAGCPAASPAIGSTLAARQDGIDFGAFCGGSSDGALTDSVSGSMLETRWGCPSAADGTAYGSDGYQAFGWGPEQGAELHHVISAPGPQQPLFCGWDTPAFGPLPGLSTEESDGSSRTYDSYGIDLSYNSGSSGVGCSLTSYATHSPQAHSNFMPHASSDPMAHCAASTVLTASSSGGGLFDLGDYHLAGTYSARPEWQTGAGFPAVTQGQWDADLHIAEEFGSHITHSGINFCASLPQQAVPQGCASQAVRQLPWPAPQTTPAPAAAQFCDGWDGDNWGGCSQTPMELLPGEACPANAVQPCGVGTFWSDPSSTAGTPPLLLPRPHCQNT